MIKTPATLIAYCKPILPQIDYVNAPESEDRVERLLRHLRCVTLAKRGYDAAQWLHNTIAGIMVRKGNVTLYWRCTEAMLDLAPSVKHAWGVLDCAKWGCVVEIEHIGQGFSVTDWYTDAEIKEYWDLVKRYGSEDAALASGLPEEMRRKLSHEETMRSVASAVWRPANCKP